jgi:hypothetical protein
LAGVVALGLMGCATTTVQKTVVDQYGLTIKLRSQAKPFGETTPRGFEQPTVIPAPRLALILGGVEIDKRADEDSVIFERRPAVPSKILGRVSEGLSQAFAEASPDQEIVVLALRKEHQHGIFHRKFLTSFVSYLKDGQLYLFFSRVEWPVDKKRAGDRLPEPSAGDRVMNITTVGNAVYQKAGAQGVRVDWRRPEFGLDTVAASPGGETEDAD